jgi:hypothetical protein
MLGSIDGLMSNAKRVTVALQSEKGNCHGKRGRQGERVVNIESSSGEVEMGEM